MANQTDAEKMKKLRARVKNLAETNRMLIKMHSEDVQRIKKLEQQVLEGVLEIEEAMKEVYLKSVCEAFGDPVLDEDTKELLGKRLEFNVLRKNNYKLNLSEKLFYPEDERYISTIMVGITYPEEEQNED